MDIPRNGEPRSLWCFFLECFPRIQIKSVGFPNESCHDSKLHARQPYQILCRNVVRSVSVKGLLPKFYLLNIQVPSSKSTGRGTLLPATAPLVYMWRHRQLAIIRQLPCDFVRETPGDMLPLPGKRNILLIPIISTELMEFLKFQ